MFRRAIERNIGIIGEAVAKILQLNPSIKIKEAKSIRSTRNYIVHAYDTLRLDMIWDIVVNDLPNLKIEISELLDCPHDLNLDSE